VRSAHRPLRLRPVDILPPRFSNTAKSVGGLRMFRISLRVFSNQLTRIGLFSCAGIVLLLAGSTAAAQRSKGSVETPAENQPGFTQFRGVKIGMATEEARKKLGSPKEKSPEQDLFVFNDTEAVNVYYDKGGAVSAITIDYLGGNTSPSLK